MGAVLPFTQTVWLSVLTGRLRAQIAGLALPHDASAVAPHVTISVGGATAMPSSGISSGDLERAADGALYEAKRTGRNRVNHHRLDATP